VTILICVIDSKFLISTFSSCSRPRKIFWLAFIGKLAPEKYLNVARIFYTSGSTLSLTVQATNMDPRRTSDANIGHLTDSSSAAK